MMHDPIYEEIDDDGLPTSRRRSKPRWQTEVPGYAGLLDDAFAATSRQQFGDQREAKDWKKICRSLDKGEMSSAWVQHCIKWARDKNVKQNFPLAIVFFRLQSLILNAVKQKEWEAQNRVQSMMDKVEIPDGPDDVVIEEEDDVTIE
jgi:hypothetical protein